VGAVIFYVSCLGLVGHPVASLRYLGHLTIRRSGQNYAPSTCGLLRKLTTSCLRSVLPLATALAFKIVRSFDMAGSIWKDREKPDLKHVLNLFQNTELGAYLAGHLLLESVLVQLIELKLTDQDKKIKPFDLSFPKKVNLAINRGLIQQPLADFLLEMNRIRNRLAHRLGEPITFDLLFNLAKAAHAGGIDFSDDTIYSNRERSFEWYGARGIIQEIFQNAAQDLSFIMEEHGGEFQFA